MAGTDETSRTEGPAAQLRTRAWLEDRYLLRGRTVLEVAEELGCSEVSVRRALLDHGIDLRAPDGPAELTDQAWLRGRYLELGHTMAEIAEAVGCSPDTVNKALWQAGIRTRNRGLPRPGRLDDARWLASQYQEAGRTAGDIASDLDCSIHTVYRALHRHGIATRPRGTHKR